MKGFPIPVPANLDPVLMKRLLNLGAWRARELPDLPYARWEEERVLGSQSTALGRVWTLGAAGMRACGPSKQRNFKRRRFVAVPVPPSFTQHPAR